MKRLYFVYIMMSHSGVALYTGVTNDLSRRVREHRSGSGQTFASRYRTSKLVWFEIHTGAAQAIAREKQIKDWRRVRKEALIRSLNPDLRDLSEDAARASAEAEFRII
ncbi:MAG: GIY-YIG nuclease family protein [Acidobacteria bacterium]|nr:GIY-YIG nuclease family protein [Acidobacteriota bacterium]